MSSEKERLNKIYACIERKEQLIGELNGLRELYPDTYGNLTAWDSITRQINQIDTQLTDLGFYRRRR